MPMTVRISCVNAMVANQALSTLSEWKKPCILSREIDTVENVRSAAEAYSSRGSIRLRPKEKAIGSFGLRFARPVPKQRRRYMKQLYPVKKVNAMSANDFANTHVMTVCKKEAKNTRENINNFLLLVTAQRYAALIMWFEAGYVFIVLG
eukprot:TRINITY_DN68125_c4_g1_i1.p2 TRINITY_DN68125_c4_g1~~TRINITY_DN68125_c4_g1_i1.p2  ORF type:complete len:149 (-),score=2.04 TRINITY_DN68125_c4_g1_i1:8-454(-)